MDNYSENLNNIEPQVPIDSASISREDFYQIWDKCFSVKNANVRARMVSNLYSAAVSKKILENFGINAVDSYSMQEISSILSKWDISELFVGGCKISVRCNFSDYKLFVPQKHEKYGLIGDILMFIRVETDLSSAKLLGFLPSENINTSNCDDENYYIEQEELKSFDEVKGYFNKPENPENIEKLESERIKIVQYIDGIIEDKIKFFKLLSQSKYLKQEMIKFELAEKFYSDIAQKEESIKQEIEKDIINISKLADAFIQSKGEILKSSENQNVESAQQFKLECARANLEKLFNASPSRENEAKNIENQTTAEVMDSLLAKSDYQVSDKRLPISALLKAFKVFVFLLLFILLAAGIFYFSNYTQYSNTTFLLTLQNHVHNWVVNVKKK